MFIIGTNAAIVVRTPKVTGMATSLVPEIAPARPGSPALLPDVDVLSDDDRVVDQDAEHHDEGEERDDVDG